jgi:hypothetical protein
MARRMPVWPVAIHTSTLPCSARLKKIEPADHEQEFPDEVDRQ